MIDPLRILAPVDGSEESESILPALLPMLRARPSEVTLLRVVSDVEDANLARGALHRLARALLMDGVRAVSRLEWGRPEEEIEYLARPARHDVLAMTTHGRSGLRRAFLGSTAETVLRRAKIPILLNRPGSRVGDWRRVVVAVDGTTPPDDLLRDLEPLVLAMRSTVHVLHVNRPIYLYSDLHRMPVALPEPDPRPYLDTVCDQLATRGILAVPATVTDQPAAGITRYLLEHDAGLLAMTTHGRDGVARAVSGSVTEAVIRQCPVPVLVRRAESSVPATA
ncbi:MAG TPA: universal stress protein [Planctomycetota bacterium]